MDDFDRLEPGVVNVVEETLATTATRHIINSSRGLASASFGARRHASATLELETADADRVVATLVRHRDQDYSATEDPKLT